jgi:hypothetical protein
MSAQEANRVGGDGGNAGHVGHAASTGPSKYGGSITAFVVGASILLGAAIAFGTIVRVYGVMLTKEAVYPANGRLLSAIPTETVSWERQGVDRKESADVEATLGTSNYISRFMRRKDGSAALDFHVAYYTGQIDTVPHVPDRCFVGGGLQLGRVIGDVPIKLDQTNWREVQDVPERYKGKAWRYRLSSGNFVILPKEPDAITFRVMEFLDREGKPFYAGYFFIANGGHVSRAEGVRLLAFDLKTRYAFYCKVQFTSVPGLTQEQFIEQATHLLSETIGEISLCLPDWLELEAQQTRDRAGGASAGNDKAQGSAAAASDGSGGSSPR